MTKDTGLKLFNVTLDWEPGDDEQGDYATSVWATGDDKAIRLVAGEMASSGEVNFDSDDERAAYVERVVGGAGQFATERVEDAVRRDLANLLKDRPDAHRAITAILARGLPHSRESGPKESALESRHHHVVPRLRNALWDLCGVACRIPGKAVGDTVEAAEE